MSLTQALSLCLILTPCLQAKPKQRFTLVIDPAGDARNPGRQIQGQYERTIAFQCAQALKTALEQTAAELLILFTRLPGQQIDHREKVRFANQMPADLYISLHVYETIQLKNQLHIYYYAHQQLSYTHLPPAHEQLTCIPLHKAHLAHATQTKQSAHFLKQQLSEPLLRHCDIHQPVGMPCLTCKGINAPALCIEIGLPKPDDWLCCLKPLTQAIYNLCLHLNAI